MRINFYSKQKFSVFCAVVFMLGKNKIVNFLNVRKRSLALDIFICYIFMFLNHIKSERFLFDRKFFLVKVIKHKFEIELNLIYDCYFRLGKKVFFFPEDIVFRQYICVMIDTWNYLFRVQLPLYSITCH